eukprot:4900310-Prymnesium_polylepis.4
MACEVIRVALSWLARRVASWMMPTHATDKARPWVGGHNDPQERQHCRRKGDEHYAADSCAGAEGGGILSPVEEVGRKHAVVRSCPRSHARDSIFAPLVACSAELVHGSVTRQNGSNLSWSGRGLRGPSTSSCTRTCAWRGSTSYLAC